MEDTYRKNSIFERTTRPLSSESLPQGCTAQFLAESGTFQSEAVNLLPKLPELKRAPNAALKTVTEDKEDYSETLKNYSVILIKHLELLFQQLQIRPDDWVIAIYARSGYGCCSGWGDHFESWTKDGSYSESLFAEFWTILSVLRKMGFSVVYLPLEQRRIGLEKSKFDASCEVAKELGLITESLQANLAKSNQIVRDAEIPFEDCRRDPFYNGFRYSNLNSQETNSNLKNLQYSYFVTL